MVGERPDLLHVGYVTLDDYHWICERCFDDFQEEFGWRLADGGGGDDA